MKYSKQATENYARYINNEECLEPLNQLIIDQACDEEIVTFNHDDVILNMDSVEERSADAEVRDLNKSMDSAFIVESAGGNREIVLVEYKCRMNGIRNLSVDELIDKVNGSTAILSNPPNTHEKYYFVYNSTIKEQVRSKLSRLIHRVPETYIALNLKELKEKFFD